MLGSLSNSFGCRIDSDMESLSLEDGEMWAISVSSLNVSQIIGINIIFHIATSVIMSLTGAAPFQGVEDQNLAVAYISAFILVFMVRRHFLPQSNVIIIISLAAIGNFISFWRTQVGGMGL